MFGLHLLAGGWATGWPADLRNAPARPIATYYFPVRGSGTNHVTGQNRLELFQWVSYHPQVRAGTRAGLVAIGELPLTHLVHEAFAGRQIEEVTTV